jgi:tetratricopeptide (TPR) repeat protein
MPDGEEGTTMDSQETQCPYCGGHVPVDATVCPACYEDLSGLARLEFQPAIHYNQALALAREGHLEDARDKLIVSTTLDESFLPAHVLLAKVYARMENWPRANEAVVRALQLAPEDSGVEYDAVRSLATRIDQLASEDQARRLREKARAADASNQNVASRDAGVTSALPVTRDLARAFALGMAVMAVPGTLWRWIGGGGREE